jgi:hypothetical protein
VHDAPVPKRARARVPNDLLPFDRCRGCQLAEFARLPVRGVVEVDVAAVDPVRARAEEAVRVGVAAGPEGEAATVAVRGVLRDVASGRELEAPSPLPSAVAIQVA